jgi:hypothetical protein
MALDGAIPESSLLSTFPIWLSAMDCSTCGLSAVSFCTTVTDLSPFSMQIKGGATILTSLPSLIKSKLMPKKKEEA